MEKICISIYYPMQQWSTVIAESVRPFFSTLKKNKCIKYEMIYFSRELGENIRMTALFDNKDGNIRLLKKALSELKSGVNKLRIFPRIDIEQATTLFLPFENKTILFNLFQYGGHIEKKWVEFKWGLSRCLMKNFSRRKIYDSDLLLFAIIIYTHFCFEQNELQPEFINVFINSEINYVSKNIEDLDSYLESYNETFSENRDLIESTVDSVYKIRNGELSIKKNSLEIRIFKNLLKEGLKETNEAVDQFNYMNQLFFTHIGLSRNVLGGVFSNLVKLLREKRYLISS